MSKLIIIIFFVPLMMSCAANKKANAGNEMSSAKKMPLENEMPSCLKTIVDSMASEPNGSPQSVASYTYNGQTVYYLVSPCCDRYNIVYDSNCNILGYPDGGYTGKGDGKMTDFFTTASNKKIIWTKK